MFASDTARARIGGYYFDSLEDAIKVASDDDIITLTNNIKLDDTLKINKVVNINLNNYTIEASEKVFLVENGHLKLSGKGYIKETKPEYGAIMIIGSQNEVDTNYSSVTVDQGVILEGWSGIFINHNKNKAYGVVVNLDGDIKAVNDTSGDSGAGIYVNGNIKHKDNSPVINIGDNTKIESTGTGIYAAGYSVYNINGADISGYQSGLGIKSGIFNINNSNIYGYGEDKTPTYGNNNGINASGASIQIESNPNYMGDISLNIENSVLTSKNSNVIYEYTTKNNDTKVESISIIDGTYISESSKDVFKLSNSFIDKHPKFISGGRFSSSPEDYLVSGYSTYLNDSGLYEVSLNTITTFKTENSNNNFIYIFLIIVVVSIAGFVSYKLLKKSIKKLS